MWKPPERIRHSTDPGTWPNRDKAAASLLFSPVDIGPVTLKARTWVPAMVPWRASEDGLVTQDVLDWYRRFAEGGPAAIVVEATGIRDISSGPLLRIGHDRYIDGLRRLTDTVKTASGGRTRLFIQLIDFLQIRRRPDPAKFLDRFLTITDDHRRALDMAGADEDVVRARLDRLDDAALRPVLSAREYEALTMGFRERVTDMDQPHIRGLPQVLPDLFADAAARAGAAGFDGVELHYAHAYTMASFLSATNTRDDDYGGNLENRARLAIDVFKRVKARVGDQFAVGCRMLADECIEGGSTVEDAAYFAGRFAEAGMDFLSFSRGGKFDDAKQPKVGAAAYPYTGPSGYECMPGYISDAFGPFGRNVEPVAAIRDSLRAAGHQVPVVLAGGIHSFEQAEGLLRDGKADIIGFARQALSDPDWFEKVRTGHGADVRLCQYTNYCEGLDQGHKMVTCKLWDRMDLDATDVRRTPDGKRRTIAPVWERC